MIDYKYKSFDKGKNKENKENKDNKENKENVINLMESEENMKLNLESTNTNSEHFINISDYYNENNNSEKSYKVLSVFEPNLDNKSEKKLNYITKEKNKRIKIDKENNEKENINNENEKNDENNDNTIVKRRNTVLSGIDEFDDFLNSYEKVNQELKLTSIKNNIRNVKLNLDGNKVSLQQNKNLELKPCQSFDVDKFKLNSCNPNYTYLFNK